MDVHLVTLDELRAAVRQLGEKDFGKTYPGAFLVAMGFLAVETIEKVNASVKAYGAMASRDATAAVTFGPRLKHDAMKNHPLAGCAFHLKPSGSKDAVMIGRGGECDITVPDRSVSETHCQIRITDRGVTAVDMRSTNGTSINLVTLADEEERVLADEDILSLGRYSFQLITSQSLFHELELLEATDLGFK